MASERLQQLKASIKSHHLDTSVTHASSEFENNRRLYMLLGGRSSRIKLVSDEKTGQTVQVVEDHNNAPALELVFTFFREPFSSLPALLWSTLLLLVSCLRLVCMALETVDGPHHYESGSTNMLYPWLPDKDVYDMFYLLFAIPFLIDAFSRILIFCAVMLEGDSLYSQMKKDFATHTLLFLNSVAIIPILMDLMASNQNDKILSQRGSLHLGEGARLIVRIFSVGCVVHIFRYMKDVHVVITVIYTAKRVAPHLMLPIFFFVLFNICAGVLFYFLEPCYDQYSCDFQDLFQAVFFCVVTMTTVGYGDQEPLYDHTRFIAVVVMLFGAIFLSMMLALVGSEYLTASSELTQQKIEEAKAMLAKMREDKMHRQVYRMQIDTLAQLTKQTAPKTEEEMEESNLENSSLLTKFRKTLAVAKISQRELNDAKAYRITPRFLLLSAELSASIEPLLISLRVTTATIAKEVDKMKKLAEAEKQAKEAIMLRNTRDDSDSDDDHSRDGLDVFEEEDANEGKDDLDGGNDVHDESTERMTSRMNRSHNKQSLTTSLADFQNQLKQKKKEDELERKRSLGKKHNGSTSGMESMVDDANGEEEDDDGSIQSVNDDEEYEMKRAQGELGPNNGDVGQKLTAYQRKLTRARLNPSAWRSKLFLLFEVPSSSKSAYGLRFLLLSMLMLHIAIFFLETFPYFTNYGETTVICGDVVRQYCSDKTTSSDRGCYVQFDGGYTTASMTFESSSYLNLDSSALVSDCYSTYRHLYDDSVGAFPNAAIYGYINASSGSAVNFSQPLNECFGQGYNFGTTEMPSSSQKYVYRPNMLTTNAQVACLADNTGTAYFPENKGFQEQAELDLTYGRLKTLFSARKVVTQEMAVCNRIECGGAPNENHDMWQSLFRNGEVVIATIFGIEFIIRSVLCDDLYEFIGDPILWLDLVTLFPFIVRVVMQAIRLKGEFKYSSLEFYMLSTAPGEYIIQLLLSLKVLRLFKLTTSFHATKVLLTTGRKIFKQLIGMFFALSMLMFLFAVLFYEIEGGTPCFVGDNGCDVPSDVEDQVQNGDRIIINKNGGISVFSNVIDCFWFCFVTATTVGYGNQVPITNGGMLLNLFLMFVGNVYLVFPLTAASSTFSTVYEKYLATKKKMEELQNLNTKKVVIEGLETFSLGAHTQLQVMQDSLKKTSKAFRVLWAEFQGELDTDTRDHGGKSVMIQKMENITTEIVQRLENGSMAIMNLAKLDIRRREHLDRLAYLVEDI